MIVWLVFVLRWQTAWDNHNLNVKLTGLFLLKVCSKSWSYLILKLIISSFKFIVKAGKFYILLQSSFYTERITFILLSSVMTHPICFKKQFSLPLCTRSPLFWYFESRAIMSNTNHCLRPLTCSCIYNSYEGNFNNRNR